MSTSDRYITKISKTTTFDEIVPYYHQLCRDINSSDVKCEPHFTSSIIYLGLPEECRDNAIKNIFSIISKRNLYNLTIDELLLDVEINELLQNKFNLDSSDLISFNKKQLNMLHDYFYDILNEISYDNYLGIKYKYY
jgi:hypothetical protein